MEKHCILCKVSAQSESAWTAHIIGKRHLKSVKQAGFDPATTSEASVSDTKPQIVKNVTNIRMSDEASDDIDENCETRAELSPRVYQLEILEAAIQHNTLAFLDTGSGKTFIAVMLIKIRLAAMRKRHLQRLKLGQTSSDQLPNKSVIAFIAPTRLLLEQQKVYISANCDCSVKCYLGGDMSARRLSVDEIVREVLTVDILLMTPELLRYVLQQNILPISLFDLIIFDECHHAIGKSPMSVCCKLIQNEPMHKRPHLFGMTASPIAGKKGDIARKLKELETTMDCKLVRPKGKLSMLELDVKIPKPAFALLQYCAATNMSTVSVPNQPKPVNKLSPLPSTSQNFAVINNETGVSHAPEDSVAVAVAVDVDVAMVVDEAASDVNRVSNGDAIGAPVPSLFDCLVSSNITSAQNAVDNDCECEASTMLIESNNETTADTVTRSSPPTTVDTVQSLPESIAAEAPATVATSYQSIAIEAIEAEVPETSSHQSTVVEAPEAEASPAEASPAEAAEASVAEAAAAKAVNMTSANTNESDDNLDDERLTCDQLFVSLGFQPEQFGNSSSGVLMRLDSIRVMFHSYQRLRFALYVISIRKLLRDLNVSAHEMPQLAGLGLDDVEQLPEFNRLRKRKDLTMVDGQETAATVTLTPMNPPPGESLSPDKENDPAKKRKYAVDFESEVNVDSLSHDPPIAEPGHETLSTGLQSSSASASSSSSSSNPITSNPSHSTATQPLKRPHRSETVMHRQRSKSISELLQSFGQIIRILADCGLLCAIAALRVSVFSWHKDMSSIDYEMYSLNDSLSRQSSRRTTVDLSRIETMKDEIMCGPFSLTQLLEAPSCACYSVLD